MSPDVVVVGAGVIGASIAWHLGRAGARTLIVERAAQAGSAPGASWASAGGLRAQGRHPAEQPLAVLAAARWRTLEAELDAWLETGFGGHLHLAETPAELALLQARIARDRAGGIDCELVDGARLRAIAPQIARSAIAGAYSAGDGQAHPGRTAAAFLAAAARGGVALRMATTARPTLAGGRVVGMTLANGDRIAAGAVALATGAWGVAALRDLGLDLPLRWRGLQMLLSNVAQPLLRPTVTAMGHNLSLKQGLSGQMMVGGNWLVAPSAVVGAVPCPPMIAPQWHSAVAILPAMAGLQLAQSWAGAEAQTIDALPVIGAAGPSGLYLALGFSGHGFQISPAVGDLVASELTGAAQPLLAPFRAARFDAVTAAAGRHFIAEPVAA